MFDKTFFDETFFDGKRGAIVLVHDTLSLSESSTGILAFTKSDTISLAETEKEEFSLMAYDTITITDRIIQFWRKLAKHVATYVHLSKSEASPTYTQESKSTSIWSFLTKNR